MDLGLPPPMSAFPGEALFSVDPVRVFDPQGNGLVLKMLTSTSPKAPFPSVNSPPFPWGSPTGLLQDFRLMTLYNVPLFSRNSLADSRINPAIGVFSR